MQRRAPAKKHKTKPCSSVLVRARERVCPSREYSVESACIASRASEPLAGRQARPLGSDQARSKSTRAESEITPTPEKFDRQERSLSPRQTSSARRQGAWLQTQPIRWGALLARQIGWVEITHTTDACSSAAKGLARFLGSGFGAASRFLP